MLRISKKQADNFLLHDEAAFIDFIAQHLREESPELVDELPDDSLRSLIASGLARARMHELRSPEDLTAFVSIMFEIAPNFDEHPAIRKVLRDPDIPVDERMDALFKKVPPKAWEEADLAYDSDAWYPELKGWNPNES
ncbi:MAG TPA: hypothetical protein VLQ93_19365 [Myxococcaceae bacterium]|nr:hypothetical protein [Myxococcaceae bacterium]